MPLALRTGAAVVGAAGPYALDSDIIQFYRDLLAPYGGGVDEALARPGRHVPFVDLAERSIRVVAEPLPAPDLLVLAYALPDLHPLKTVSSHLNHLFGDRSRSFAISEQGLRAPFTALRVADAYARSGRCASLALFVLEQTTFAYPEPFAHSHELVDSGVLMFFDEAGDWAVSAVRMAAPGDDLGALLSSGVPPEDTLLVAGPWTDPAVLATTGLPCHRAEPGSYCTSVWRELSRHHQDWARRYRTVVLCDTDVRLGPTHIAVLTRVAAPPAPPAPPAPRKGIAVTAPQTALLDRLQARGYKLPGTDEQPLGDRLLELHRTLLRRALAHAMAHLDSRFSEGTSLLARPQIQADLADVAMELRESELPGPGVGRPERIRWACHRRLTGAGRTLLHLLGASSMLADGPGGDLYLMELLGNAWLHPGSPATTGEDGDG